MTCIGASIWSGKRRADLICCNLQEHHMHFQQLHLLRSSGWNELANYSQTLIIPSNMDLHCCFVPFKKVLQTHASRCRFATVLLYRVLPELTWFGFWVADRHRRPTLCHHLNVNTSHLLDIWPQSLTSIAICHIAFASAWHCNATICVHL